MLLSMVTVTCPGTFVGAERVEGGAGAMGRLGIVGFRGGCKKYRDRNVGNSKGEVNVEAKIESFWGIKARRESQLCTRISMAKYLERKDIGHLELFHFCLGQRKGIFCTGNTLLLTYSMSHKWNLSGLQKLPHRNRALTVNLIFSPTPAEK